MAKRKIEYTSRREMIADLEAMKESYFKKGGKIAVYNNPGPGMKTKVVRKYNPLRPKKGK